MKTLNESKALPNPLGLADIEYECEKSMEQIALERERAERAEAEISRLRGEVEELTSDVAAACDCVRTLRATNERLADLLTAFSDAVEKVAFQIPAPNPYTPNFIQMVISTRAALTATQEKGNGNG